MIDKTSYELKPCPFCGSKSIRIIYINGNEKRYASCYKCGARTKNGDTTKEAIKRWNERVSCQELLR